MTLKLSDPSPQIWGENVPFWFLALARLGSFFLMMTGLFYWADILGVFGDSGLERGSWQEAAIRVLLSCSFLIASIGVWQLSFWGVVIWVLSSIGQAIAFTQFEGFAANQAIINILHLVGFLTLLGSTGWIYYKAMQEKD